MFAAALREQSDLRWGKRPAPARAFSGRAQANRGKLRLLNIFGSREMPT
jgi:hypothetical protein